MKPKIKNLGKIGIMLVVFTWLVPSVLAFGSVFNLEVKSNKNQERIYLGDYWETEYTITNNNIVCEITCNLPSGLKTTSLKPGNILKGTTRFKVDSDIKKKSWHCWGTSQSWPCKGRESQTVKFSFVYSYCGDFDCDPEEDYYNCRKDCEDQSGEARDRKDECSGTEKEGNYMYECVPINIPDICSGPLKEWSKKSCSGKGMGCCRTKTSDDGDEDWYYDDEETVITELYHDTLMIEKEDEVITASELNELIQQHEDTTLIIEGKNINFDDYGFILNEGRIRISGEGIFTIDVGDYAIIDGIRINNDGQRETYFGSDEIEEVYLVFNNKKIEKDNVIEFRGNKIYINGFENCVSKIEFNPGNSIIEIEENDKFIIYPSGGEASIKNDNGKISVDIKGDMNLENDEYSLFYINDEKVKVLTSNLFEKERTSVPMDIFYSSDNTNIKYEMDNNERLTSYGETIEGHYKSSDEEFRIYKSDGEETLTRISWMGNDLVDPNQVLDLYYDLTPETRESISFIEYVEKIPEEREAAAFASGTTQTQQDEHKYSETTFSHESAHILNYALEQKGSDFTLKWLKTAMPDSIIKEVPVPKEFNVVAYTPEEYDKAMDKYTKFIEETKSKAKIEAKDKNIDTKKETVIKSFIYAVPGNYIVIGPYLYVDDDWIEVSSKKANKKGCARNYGLKNYKEDVATMVEYINYDPGYVASLMAENSIIKNKVKLLYQYDFISKEQHDELNR